MYAVLGATGQTGGATLRELRRRGAPVRAISRDASRARDLLGPGVEVVEADTADVAALAAAFAGTRGVFVQNVPPIAADDIIAAAAQVSANIAAALREARPGRVVALSSEGAQMPAGAGVIRTLHDFEAALLGAGVPLTRLRPTWFMENWGAGVVPAQAEGVLPSLLQPLDRRFRMVGVADVGATAADLLLADAAPQIVHLAGPQDYAPDAAAAAFATAFGRPVDAIAPPRESWEAELVAAGLGASYAAGLAAMYDAINAGAVGVEPGVGEERRGRTTLDDVLAAMAANAGAYAEAHPA